MLRSDLCNYSDDCVVVKGGINVTGTNAANRRNKKLTFKNNAFIRSCISRISNTITENAEDFYIVMLMCNVLEYSDNCSMTPRTLWNYYRDK